MHTTVGGDMVGKELGKRLGSSLGTAVGLEVGPNVGPLVGPNVGGAVAARVGSSLGTAVGLEVGGLLATKVGSELGTPVGARLRTASSGAGQPPLLTLNGFTLTLVEVSGQKSQRPQVTGQKKAKSPAQPLLPAFDATSKQKADAAQDSGQEE